MRQRRSGLSPVALIVSIALHAGLVYLIITGWQWWKREPVSPVAVQTVKATVVDQDQIDRELEALKAAERKREAEKQAKAQREKEALERTRRQRKAEEKRLADAKRQKQAAEKKRQAEEKALEAARKAKLKAEQEAKKQAAEDKKRRQDEAKAEQRRKVEEKQRREREALKKAESERKRKAEEKKRRAEAERKRKAAEDARRAAEAEKALQDSLARERAEGERRRQAREIDRYTARIIERLHQNWVLPPNLARSMTAKVRVRLAPGGTVISVAITRPSGDVRFDRSTEQAVYRAEPLPVPDDPALFNKFRSIEITFDPQEIE